MRLLSVHGLTHQQPTPSIQNILSRNGLRRCGLPYHVHQRGTESSLVLLRYANAGTIRANESICPVFQVQGSCRMHAVAVFAFLLAVSGATEAAPVEKGTAKFTPVGDQKNVPERYRLQAHTFDWEMTPKF